ncbi:DHH family phosphoesterase [Vibrio sp. La 4.2.2]|uniref:DHH family phosphoesterase n=1 Tax=Vibrio sp. La 4.2.2 TaxID=2998830 RepID=UPI0022CE18D3|nr:DHH family phosphoesterase [Vibrio sp. La 4.2.2]MDA0110541.1 DHH family phosphoesterase [Vibrio sp. La 4.2.2]
MHYDVFNGDADGIIALIQLRLDDPKESILITGVKRDIKLLAQVVDSKDVSSVTALDISMEKNMPALEMLLTERNVPVFYCDHHRSGDIPQSSLLTADINLDAEVCTSLLINKRLDGKHSHWAIAGAFGDNLFKPALSLATSEGLPEPDIEFLKELGTLINYNGYGASEADLHIEPAILFRQLVEFESPLMLRDDQSSPFYVLKKGYEQDYLHVSELSPVFSDEICEVYQLPCESWARRISGVFGNELANRNPDKAHAVLTQNQDGQSYTVSVRAPLNNRNGADEICVQFPTGGGRKAAAGINQLPMSDKDNFINVLQQFYS